MDEDIQTFITSSDINTKIKLPIKSEIQGSLTNTSYEITGEQGNIADLTLSGPIELSKGKKGHLKRYSFCFSFSNFALLSSTFF